MYDISNLFLIFFSFGEEEGFHRISSKFISFKIKIVAHKQTNRQARKTDALGIE